eukprot:s823_g4.t1
MFTNVRGCRECEQPPFSSGSNLFHEQVCSLSTWRLLFWQVMPLDYWSALLLAFHDPGKAMASQHCLTRGLASCTSRTNPCSCGSCECSLAPPDKGVAAEMCS